MNKNGETDNKKTILVVVLLLVVLIGGYMLLTQTKTVEEHKTPADISSGEKGTGLDLKFYDTNGNEISVPSWFSTASIVDMEGKGFAIASRTSAPSCSDRTQCTGYATNPNILCWSGKCVLGNVGSMSMGVSVTNPSSSQITFTNILPVAGTPAALFSAMDKTPAASLSPGNTVSWVTATPVSITTFVGTNQTFSITVNGTNSYTGAVNSISDSLILQFLNDPTGSLNVALSSPI
jgi:hypothetical protein